jgi:rare lipoprotein A
MKCRGTPFVCLSIFFSAIAFSSPSSAGSAAGIASVYGNGDGYAWRKTANGERMNPGAMTAAHRTLPFGTRVSVVNQRNGKSVVVRISDRGPFVRGRIIDLTPAGARAIGFSGLAPVKLTVLGGATAPRSGGRSPS